MTCALLVQGAWHHRWTERWEHYVDTFDQIVISVYKKDAHKLCLYPHILDHPKTTIVLNDGVFPQGADWYGNIYYQCLTTRSGLRHVWCDHVIKTRTDEYFSNMHIMRDQIASTRKNASINIYFKRPRYHAFHIGDHLFGGPTSLFQKGFDILQHHVRHDLFHNTSLVAEQKICISLLLASGEAVDWHHCGSQMLRHWTVVDARRLEPFWFNGPSVGTVGGTLDDIAACEAGDESVELFDCVTKYFE